MSTYFLQGCARWALLSRTDEVFWVCWWSKFLIGFLISLHQQRAEGEAFWPQSKKTDSSLTWSLTNHVLLGRTTLPFGIKSGCGTKEFLRSFLAQVFCVSKFLCPWWMLGHSWKKDVQTESVMGSGSIYQALFYILVLRSVVGREEAEARQLLDMASQLKDS